MADQDAGEGPAESEWRFPLSAFDGDDEEQVAQPSASAERPAEEAEDGQAGADPGRIEPGDPTIEGTLFVLLGVAFALFVLSRLVVG